MGKEENDLRLLILQKVLMPIFDIYSVYQGDKLYF